MFVSFPTEIIHPYLAEIVNYMLISTGDADETVAQEACEFWLAISEDATVAAFLEPHLPQLLAQLLHHMRYTDMQIILLRGDEDDAGHADADEDIRPHHVRSRTCAGGGIGGNGGSAGRGGAVGAEDDEDEDEDDDGDNDAAEALAEWTLRKSASSSLDALAVVFGDATVQHDAQDNMLPNTFLETLLPLLQQLLTSPQWYMWLSWWYTWISMWYKWSAKWGFSLWYTWMFWWHTWMHGGTRECQCGTCTWQSGMHVKWGVVEDWVYITL